MKKPGFLRRFLPLLICFASIPPAMGGNAKYFTEISDIRSALRENPGKVAVVLVTQSDCSSCGLLSNKILKPIVKSGKFADKMALREISLDAGSEIVDFSGNRVSTQRFLKDYNVKFSPVLLFLGADGEELNPAQVGLGPLDYHSYYVEKAIEESFENLRKNSADA